MTRLVVRPSSEAPANEKLPPRSQTQTHSNHPPSLQLLSSGSVHGDAKSLDLSIFSVRVDVQDGSFSVQDSSRRTISDFTLHPTTNHTLHPETYSRSATPREKSILGLSGGQGDGQGLWFGGFGTGTPVNDESAAGEYGVEYRGNSRCLCVAAPGSARLASERNSVG
ncbi:hypothetical protein C8J56DRAFT_1027130 [Mycena floridula]|nr:hypothetical protein C8J56DRAFT_1027130 [Mycena floridula]